MKVINRKLRIGCLYTSDMTGYKGYLYKYLGWNKEKGYKFEVFEFDEIWIPSGRERHFKSRHFVYTVFRFINRRQICIGQKDLPAEVQGDD